MGDALLLLTEVVLLVDGNEYTHFPMSTMNVGVMASVSY